MTQQDTYQAFMLDYVAGALSPAMRTAATLHRLMTSEGDEAAELWEITRAELLRQSEQGSEDVSFDPDIEAALSLIHTDYDEVSWRRGVSGVHYSPRTTTGGQLMHLKPGQSLFTHGHSALEATVVLEGVFEDGLGTYVPGDIVLATPGLRHRPAAGGNSACTCYVAKESTKFWRLT
ncbi:cupin domain-containing protein [Henriciella sp. AS95]|uniref:cupin domain-containing protein n=1 Tax=Henriciella sp. AS95 TaxID=3135782 RepID=UPI0031702382